VLSGLFLAQQLFLSRSRQQQQQQLEKQLDNHSKFLKNSRPIISFCRAQKEKQKSDL
jgi:hypothetical protein